MDSKREEFLLLSSLQERFANGAHSEDEQIIMQLMDIISKKNELLKESSEILRSTNEELRRIDENAKRDALTGLYNRKGIKPYFLKQIVNYNSSLKTEPLEKLTVVAIDLDHFKSINDNYGHDIGDLALKIVAGGMTRTFKKKDLIVREGGDEFLVVVKNCDESVLRHKLNEMCEYITDCVHKELDAVVKYKPDGSEYHVPRTVDYTVSCGLCDMDLSQLNEEMLSDDEAFEQWFNAQKKAADDMSYAVKEEHHAVRK